MWRVRHLGLSVFLSAQLPAAAGVAVAGAFLFLEDIPGECARPSHSNWVEVTGLSFEKAADGDGLALLFEKAVDTASPLLCKAVAAQTPVSKGVLELTRATGRQQRFFQLKLYNITLDALSTVATNGVACRPAERLALSCTKVEWTYVLYPFSGVNLAVGDVYDWWDWVNKQGGPENSERDTDGDGIPDLADEDVDDDGMPDLYEGGWKLLPTVDDALDDLDGDGMGNRDEYWSGTSPVDPGSVFRISRMDLGSGFLRVTWTSQAKRSYDLFTGGKPDDITTCLGTFPSQGDETSAEFKTEEVGWFFRVRTPAVVP